MSKIENLVYSYGIYPCLSYLKKIVEQEEYEIANILITEFKEIYTKSKHEEIRKYLNIYDLDKLEELLYKNMPIARGNLPYYEMEVSKELDTYFNR